MSATTTEQGRSFTEGEAYALVDDNVKRETAKLTEKVEALEAAKSALETEKDVLETEKAQAIQRAEAAEQALTDYRNEAEAEKAREAKRAERKAQLAEANPHLEITEAREERIVAMDDEQFAAYLEDMREVASKVTTPPPAGDVPSQSAAFGGGGDAPKKATTKGLFLASRKVQASAYGQKGA